MNRRDFVALGVGGAAAAASRHMQAQTIGPDVAELYPSGGDDTPQINAALASFGPRGGELIFHTGLYSVPNGIVENVPGLVVRGLGHRVQGPITTSALGVVLRTSVAGAWCWTRTAGAANEYRGASFSGVTFCGDATSAGGLQLNTCYNRIVDCLATGYTGAAARGFYVYRPSISGGSAQENFFVDCGAQNCMTGLETTSADGSEIRGFITLKTTAGGIHNQGTGILVQDNNTRIIGGKIEGNSTGIVVRSVPGINITGTTFEDNSVYDIDLDKNQATQTTTKNLVAASAGKVRIGPWNFGDRVIGMRYPDSLTDVPNPQGLPKGTVRI